MADLTYMNEQYGRRLYEHFWEHPDLAKDFQETDEDPRLGNLVKALQSFLQDHRTNVLLRTGITELERFHSNVKFDFEAAPINIRLRPNAAAFKMEYKVSFSKDTTEAQVQEIERSGFTLKSCTFQVIVASNKPSSEVTEYTCIRMQDAWTALYNSLAVLTQELAPVLQNCYEELPEHWINKHPESNKYAFIRKVLNEFERGSARVLSESGALAAQHTDIMTNFAFTASLLTKNPRWHEQENSLYLRVKYVCDTIKDHKESNTIPRVDEFKEWHAKVDMSWCPDSKTWINKRARG